MQQREIWRNIEGFNGAYKVSNMGRVKSLMRRYSRNGKIFKIKGKGILKNHINKRGYNYVSLSKREKHKKYKVHRLVANAFIPNPGNKPFIDHIDGNKTNNNVNNLRWCTSKENNNNPITKQKIQKRIICKDIGVIFESLVEAEKLLNIRRSSISNVLRGAQKLAGGYNWEYADKKAC